MGTEHREAERLRYVVLEGNLAEGLHLAGTGPLNIVAAKALCLDHLAGWPTKVVQCLELKAPEIFCVPSEPCESGDPAGQHVVIAGDFLKGLQAFGPFASQGDAAEFAGLNFVREGIASGVLAFERPAAQAEPRKGPRP